ncbi:MAG: SAM-dependent methyltransferase [Acidobacteria bacterium]|nr:SAM-dependent methyltransferase [Acidobacteriota bacterium]
MDDAELLFEHRRWAAADQLYGFSAECGLKAVMRAHGVSVAKKHVQDFWPIFEAFLQGPSGARYLSLLPGGAPFADWSHHDRYAHGRHFDEAIVERHRAAARGIRGLVALAPPGASHDEPDHPVR